METVYIEKVSDTSIETIRDLIDTVWLTLQESGSELADEYKKETEELEAHAETPEGLKRQIIHLSKKYVKIKRKKQFSEEDQKMSKKPCFGAFAEGDDSCEDCSLKEDCKEETKELEADLKKSAEEIEEEELEETPKEEEEDAEENQEQEQKEEVSGGFDPSDLDLAGSDRIDVLAKLTRSELDAVASYLGLATTEAQDDAEIILQIDDHIAEFNEEIEEDTESEKEEEPVEQQEEEEQEEVETPEEEEESEQEQEEKKSESSEEIETTTEEVEPPEEIDASEEEPEIVEEEETPEGVEEEDSPGISKEELTAQVALEQLEFLLKQYSDTFSAHADPEALVSFRNLLNDIINTALKKEEKTTSSKETKTLKPVINKDLRKFPEEIEEELTEHEEEKKTATKKKEDESQDPEDYPSWFAEEGEKVGYPISTTRTRLSLKDGGQNVATILVRKTGSWLLFNRGAVDELPGTEPRKSNNDYPAMKLADDGAHENLKTHIENWKRVND